MTRFASLFVGALALVCVAGTGPRISATADAESGVSEIVVLLKSPPLAEAPARVTVLEQEQRAFRRVLSERVPAAEIEWRYRLVANGFSVSLPTSQLRRVRELPGVRDVIPAATYGQQLDSSPQQIGAPALWGPGLDTAGQGMKIGIIDSGVDAGHPFFDPAGYTMPPGFPKGQQRFTTAKVIVARVFAPKTATAPSARLAFSMDDSPHGTHVAGIAAGNPNTPAGGRRVSGVAPRAYIGNYKVFVETDSGESPNANSPAIVAAIEAAVADGMDVINFSGGEPEIEPSNDIVARALDAAATAGVVPVIAAGNDYNDFGAGSVSSPANSERAIAVGAVEINGSPAERTHAEFSSVGPTTISLRLKPDVAAPGVNVLSSVSGGGWAEFSGTSMASPHIAGAAALLRQRHPEWTVAQVKSVMMQSGNDVVDDRGRILGPQFQGGGLVALPRADKPLLFAEPSSLSFGLLARRSTVEGSIRLDDAGGGAGSWQVAEMRPPASTAGGTLALPAAVNIPGTLSFELVVPASARLGDVTGFIELRRGVELRRVPFWGSVRAPALGRHALRELSRPGTYTGSTSGQPAFVSRYRYPENPRGTGITTVLRGPERVYAIRLAKRAVNFGVVILRRGRGARVEPRVVAQFDENRLTGYAGLPVAYNPYLDDFRSPVPAAGALSPIPGDYAVVFDSASRAGAGSFTFRYWVNDVTPPTLSIPKRTVASDRPLRVIARDSGSGVYPDSIVATIDGDQVPAVFRGGVVSISTSDFTPGRHRLKLHVSDFQESKNTENVARILPNTRTLTTTIRIR